MLATDNNAHIDAPQVVTRAFLRAAETLGISQKTQSQLLGVSEASISRLVKGTRQVDVDGKEGELALLFIRMYRSLATLLGNEKQRCRAWLEAENIHLGGVPVELIQHITGLVQVTQYLDAMRGRV